MTHEAIDPALRTYMLTSLEPYTEYFIRITAAYAVLIRNYAHHDTLDWFGTFSPEVSIFTPAEGTDLHVNPCDTKYWGH